MAKYKVLKSIAHNHSESFVGFNNYVDNGYVIDDLRNVIRELDNEILSVYWIPQREQSKLLTRRILQSIEYWSASFPDLVKNSGGSMDNIREYQTDFYLKPSKQIAIEARIVDDRGREYVSPIYNF